jgi:hypothetical protein
MFVTAAQKRCRIAWQLQALSTWIPTEKCHAARSGAFLGRHDRIFFWEPKMDESDRDC